MGKDVFLVNMGRRIAQERKALHLTQEQLAERMGVSLQTISCIELGKKAVRPENLANLCVILGVTADYILFGKRDERKMNDTVSKLSVLDPEAYQTVRDLIDMLADRRP